MALLTTSTTSCYASSAAYAGCLLLFFSPFSAAGELSMAEIQQLVTAQLSRMYEERHGQSVAGDSRLNHAGLESPARRVSIETAALDPRLTIPACELPPQVELNGNRSIPASGRVSVKVSCQGSSPWAKYLGATIRLYRQVVTLRHAVDRDAVLDAADLELREIDVSRERREPLQTVETAIGKTLRQSMQSGDVLSAGLLVDPVIISRGDLVEITARSGGIAISQRGIALQGGKAGAAIDIRNASSDVIVQAQVIGPGKVLIQL